MTTQPATPAARATGVQLTCGPCGTVITGADEDDLIARVQEHARSHDNTELSREHILAHLRGEHPDEPEPRR